jgi:hypothetical protein
VQNGGSGIASFDVGPTPTQGLVYGGIDFKVTGSALTGTTGLANEVSVNALDDGTIQIENRRGGSFNFLITVF